MPSQEEVLKALASKEGVVTTPDLATEVSATQDSVRAHCSQLKKKGYVDGSTKEGWIITSEGKAALERREKIPVTPEDVGADTKSKLEYYGKLAGVAPDLILATSEIILSGDPEDLEQVWEAMTQMDVPIANRRRWFNLWRNYLKQGIPPSLREKVVGTLETAEEAGEEAVSAKEKGRDYIIADDVPVFVGHGQGDFSLKDAKDIIGMRALRYRFAGQGGTPAQGFGPKDIIDIVEKITAARGDKTPPKCYVVTPGEGGTIVQEVEPGQPLLVPAASSKEPPTTYLVDKGEVKQIKSGEPIIIKEEAHPPLKTYIVRQTEKGIVTEEHDLGKPIIINASLPSSNLPPMWPFPALSADGKPMVDDKGNPILVNIEPMLKYMGFMSEQKRADERHGALMELAQTVKENLPIGIEAFSRAVAEVKGKSAESAVQQYECGSCHTKFTLPRVPGEDEKVICPNCHQEWTGKEVLSA